MVFPFAKPIVQLRECTFLFARAVRCGEPVMPPFLQAGRTMRSLWKGSGHQHVKAAIGAI
jgi:hypothetical protein